MTRIVLTGANGANGDGYGALLYFSADGELAGPFSQDRRITDPRGLSLSPAGDLVYVDSGDERARAGRPLLPDGVVRSREPNRLDDVRLLRAQRYSADAPGRTAGLSGIPRDKSSFSCRGVPACR